MATQPLSDNTLRDAWDRVKQIGRSKRWNRRSLTRFPPEPIALPRLSTNARRRWRLGTMLRLGRRWLRSVALLGA
jgi:hypothetical protein